jgi:hypothetical protein
MLSIEELFTTIKTLHKRVRDLEAENSDLKERGSLLQGYADGFENSMKYWQSAHVRAQEKVAELERRIKERSSMFDVNLKLEYQLEVAMEKIKGLEGRIAHFQEAIAKQRKDRLDAWSLFPDAVKEKLHWKEQAGKLESRVKQLETHLAVQTKNSEYYKNLWQLSSKLNVELQKERL